MDRMRIINQTAEWKRIREAIEQMKVVDTHEHIANPFIPERKYDLDLISFLTRWVYLYFDLVSSGMKPNSNHLLAGNRNLQVLQRWKQLKPHLENVKNTSFYRYLLVALRDLYGLEDEDIDDKNWAAVSRCLNEKSKDHIKWYLEILDKMKVCKVILDISDYDGPGAAYNPNIMKDDRLVQVLRMDGFIFGSLQAAGQVQKRIHSLDDYLSLLEESLDNAVRAGIVGIKVGLAYQRVISFDKVTKSEAARIFTKGVNKANTQKRKMFQDFMMHAICQRIASHNLPLQIHTGIQGGHYCKLTDTKPTHLTNLFQEYPEVKFDLFHGGYPYIQEAGLMAKHFPNVYIDGCWLTQVSPTAYKRALDEWLEILPANKIFAWGGDHGIIDHSYASLMLAKDLITDVLAAKVKSGYLSEKEAISVARKILGENAIKVYGF